jgi:thioredoxin 2
MMNIQQIVCKSVYPHARFVKINTQEQRALSLRYGVQSLPTLAVFRAGKEVARQTGALAEAGMTRWIHSVIS